MFWNLFGPTETNVCSAHRVQHNDIADGGPVPIGRAIRDTRLYVVDEAGKAVEPGRPGELWVSGPTLMAGYFGDAERSACRLVAAPDGSGAIAFRTGDRVQDRGDGVLMFLGRSDRMIKSRGYRVELGDVEAAIQRHPDVLEAAAVPTPDPVFGHAIRAAVAPRPGARLNADDLDRFCREQLPSHMLPMTWDVRDALPRTSRGKIYHQRLQRELAAKP
jgi:acyl-coenzyme A synthetase/AMP-(fatty) acid ligase